MPVKGKKPHKIYMAEDDEELLSALRGEYQQEGLEISDSNIVSLALKALSQKKGGKSERDHATDARSKRKRTKAS